MAEFVKLSASGEVVVVPIPDFPETIYPTGGRIRWTLSPGSAIETSTNSVAGTHDGLTTSFDGATSILDGGLAYSVGYSVATPGVASIASVTLRMRYKTTAAPTTVAALYELSAVYDNTLIGASTLAPPVLDDWTWLEYEMTTNPTTGLAWANGAAVSAKKWGFSFDSGAANGVNTFSCAEIELLVTPS